MQFAVEAPEQVRFQPDQSGIPGRRVQFWKHWSKGIHSVQNVTYASTALAVGWVIGLSSFSSLWPVAGLGRAA